jgi:hypothetical protein
MLNRTAEFEMTKSFDAGVVARDSLDGELGSLE